MALPSANMNSKFGIDKILYLRSPIFPIFFLAVAASASPSQLTTIFNAGKNSIAFISLLTTGDCELVRTTTNQREIPNVKDEPRPRLARSLRMQDA
jgi:hypothetical protein